MTDYIGDHFSRIRNAQMSKQSFTFLNYTKISLNIVKILQDEGFIRGFSIDSSKKMIKTFLRYNNNTIFIKKIKRISKPSRRVFFSLKFLASLNFNAGIFLISTPKGLMTHKKALKLGLGGEAICFIL